MILYSITAAIYSIVLNVYKNITRPQKLDQKSLIKDVKNFIKTYFESEPTVSSLAEKRHTDTRLLNHVLNFQAIWYEYVTGSICVCSSRMWLTYFQ
jgi:hypothetical protein